MTRYVATAILALVTLASSFAQIPTHVPGQALVRFSSEAAAELSFSSSQGKVIPSTSDLASLFERLGVWRIEPLHPYDAGTAFGISAGLDREYVVYFRPSLESDQALDLIRGHPEVEQAQFNRLCSVSDVPNDPYYPSQWGLPKVGMPSAWNITHGSASVRIAVLDVGFKLNHVDLSSKFSAIYRRDETDIDLAFYRDQLHYVPYYDEDYTVPDNDPSETRNNHGTGVAGVAAASSGNSLGVAGVGWANEIVPVRCGFSFSYPSGGWVETDDWIRALDWVRNQAAAKVVNMSFGRPYEFDGADPLEQTAINNAVNSGIVVCVSSGNSRGSGGEADSVGFPAAYDNAIAVGATIGNDDVAIWSCVGSKLSLVAPGVDIYTTSFNTTSGVATYEQMSGTSFACPHAAGLAALIKSINPSLTPAQVKDILRQSADDVSQMGGQGFTIFYGDGRLNAYKALSTANGAPNPPQNITITGAPGQHPTISWLANTEPDLAGYKIYRKIPPFVTAFVLIATVNSSTTSYVDNYIYVNSGSGDPTAYYYVKAYDAANYQSHASSTVSIHVHPPGWPKLSPDLHEVPSAYQLFEAYPNPFNPSTEIRFGLAADARVSLAVYDVLGQEVTRLAGGYREAGYHSVIWDAAGCASGVYYARLIVTSELGKVVYWKTNKLLLAR
jgi:hypothetical protein